MTLWTLDRREYGVRAMCSCQVRALPARLRGHLLVVWGVMVGGTGASMDVFEREVAGCMEEPGP